MIFRRKKNSSYFSRKKFREFNSMKVHFQCRNSIQRRCDWASVDLGGLQKRLLGQSGGQRGVAQVLSTAGDSQLPNQPLFSWVETVLVSFFSILLGRITLNWIEISFANVFFCFFKRLIILKATLIFIKHEKISHWDKAMCH